MEAPVSRGSVVECIHHTIGVIHRGIGDFYEDIDVGGRATCLVVLELEGQGRGLAGAHEGMFQANAEIAALEWPTEVHLECFASEVFANRGLAMRWAPFRGLALPCADDFEG